MLHAIFFDAAGTLIHLPRSVGEHYREAALRFGVDVPADALDRAFRQVWKEAPARPPTPDGAARPEDDKGWWRALVGGVLARTLPVAERPENFVEADLFEALYSHFAEPGVWEAFPDVKETLSALRAKGLRLAVVSNFDRRLPTVLGHLGLAGDFERVILSSEVGADKPDPRIFERALRAMEVSAAEAMHVGDEPARDGGAEALGLRFFHLRRPENGLRDLLTLVGRGGF